MNTEGVAPFPNSIIFTEQADEDVQYSVTATPTSHSMIYEVWETMDSYEHNEHKRYNRVLYREEVVYSEENEFPARSYCENLANFAALCWQRDINIYVDKDRLIPAIKAINNQGRGKFHE